MLILFWTARANCNHCDSETGKIYLPNDLLKDLFLDAKQLGEWGAGIVEAVQQNLEHLFLLLSFIDDFTTPEISIYII